VSTQSSHIRDVEIVAAQLSETTLTEEIGKIWGSGQLLAND
jgi:hypothetical protein